MKKLLHWTLMYAVMYGFLSFIKYISGIEIAVLSGLAYIIATLEIQ